MKSQFMKKTKIKALVLLGVLVAEIVAPIGAHALTGGPSQPEVESFEPVGTSQMVDVFSGDFNYNIPLLDVNGYPVNIAYHAGVSTDQEASWVGLGWNVNPGTINRDMRGLPDDMKGEKIIKEINLKKNITFGLNASLPLEVFGLKLKNKNASLSYNIGIKYNNYKGLSLSVKAQGGLDLPSKKIKEKLGSTPNVGLALGFSDGDGISLEPDISLERTVNSEKGQKYRKHSFSIGTSFNTTTGLQSMNLGKTVSQGAKSGSVRSGSGLSNSGITHSFALQTYTPGISTPMVNSSINFNFKPGGSELFGLHAAVGMSGFYSEQFIPADKRRISKRGYGYLYEHEVPTGNNPADKDYLLDFNRVNDGALSKIQPYLGWINHTNDMYNVAAQGVGGMYRLYRNDIPLLHDDYRTANSNGYRAGAELGGGNLVKGGANVGFNHNSSVAGFWSEGNALQSKLGSVSKSALSDTTNTDYEPVYFREVGEIMGQSSAYLDLVGGEDAVNPRIAGHTLAGYLETPKSTTSRYINFDNQKVNNVAKERTRRNKMFMYLTQKDRDLFLNKTLKTYDINTISYKNGELEHEEIKTKRNPHHIGEVSILGADGSRYVFGIPAYNNKKIEKNFRVGTAFTADKNKGEITYQSQDDELNGNQQGIDNYYSSTETPGYVHSYLISGVLSPDYVDMTGDGISDDDLGSAVKFNYTRVKEDYKWRAPYNSNKAKYDEGLRSNENDNTGSYIYGEKEIWHLHSIEGKTHVGIFFISPREDGLGVAGIKGGKNEGAVSYKLDSIALYSKGELQELGEDAIPIKTVHFRYSYDLCKGIENSKNGAGKLTLNEIFFTYGKSHKGRLNSYVFEYNQDNADTYHLSAYDSWGTYAPPRNGSITTTTNSEFPYTIQTKSEADEYASLWNLSKVILPSGGVINVNYEADDYGYVQNKRAMRMFKVKEVGTFDKDDNQIKSQTELYQGAYSKDYDLIYFDLDSAISNIAILKKEYFQGIKQLQATFYINISGSNWEYIKTYVDVSLDSYGDAICGLTNGGTEAWVQIQKVNVDERPGFDKVNPIAKAAWEFTRTNLNYLINPASDKMQSNAPGLGLISSLGGFIQELSSQAAGYNKVLKIRNFCQNFNPSKSWIRLNDPDKIKYGGGHRVKSISLDDSWEAINSQDNDVENSQYGQTYDYTIEEKSSAGYYTTISSGVASYEPMMGRDENPFVYAEYYDEKRRGVPDVRYTFEHPIGESYFPGASVGYSKITVRSLAHVGQSENHRTGYQVSEFHTYKDYPTIVHASDISTNSRFDAPPKIAAFAFGSSDTKGTAAQGYTVILNDMHGKPKANWSYNEEGTRISGAKYIYAVNSDGTLKNEMLVAYPDGSLKYEKMGVSVDFAIDNRMAKDQFFDASLDLNLDAFALGIFPLFIPYVMPNVSFSSSETRTASSIKIIRKSGLLVKTIAYKEGSEISTENLLYDARTGQVLLSSVRNEFNDNIYSFNYPAHWVYDEGMGQAFQNWGLEMKGIGFSSGKLFSHAGSTANIDKWLVPGDECLFKYQDGRKELVWVYETTGGGKVLIDKDGNVVTGDNAYWPKASIRIIRSGRRNMAGISIGSVICMENPIKQSGPTYYLDFNEILATSAVEYKDDWKTDLSLFAHYNCDTNATTALTTLLTDIDTKIQNDYFLDSSLTRIYDLDTCSVCPTGYTYIPSSKLCEKTDTATATFNGTDSADVKNAINVWVYGSYGTRIYENITNKPLPISSIGSTSNYEVRDNNSSALSISTLINTGNFWKYPSGSGKDNYGRLNVCGVWPENIRYTADMPPVNKWIGFSKCFDVPEEKTYYVGFGSDDYCKMEINGKIIVEFDGVTDRNFKFWHIFPMTLKQGKNIIELTGLNTGNIAAFGAEIYDASSSELQQISTEAELDSVLIFSTKNMIGGHFTVGDVGSDVGYSCPSGYSLDLCSDSIRCISIDRIDADSCGCTPQLFFLYDDVSNVMEVLDYSMNNLNSARLTCKVLNSVLEIDTVFGLLYAPCDTLFNCTKTCENEYTARVINPYRTGVKGNWRPYKSWTYVDDRNYSASANPQQDGAFSSFADFWQLTSGNYDANYSNTKWVWTSEVTEYSPFGMELENMDPLGRYSAALYGYGQTLPVAVASNTQHRQLWYEGFEEYAYQKTIENNYVCPPWQFPYVISYDSFMSESYGNLDHNNSHSGNSSLRIVSGSDMVQEITLSANYTDYLSMSFKSLHYLSNADNRLVNFQPSVGSYIVSAWVQEKGNPLDSIYDDSYIELEFEDSVGNKTTTQLRPSGQIIEGWQRIEESIEVPSTAKIMRIKFKTSTSISWFDDVRFFPSSGNMKSYAYDSRTLRLMAELDENNFATLYEYDLEGNLVRVKKETERGIKTLQENRQHNKASDQ